MTKQKGLYQNKVTLSLASIDNCKMAYSYQFLETSKLPHCLRDFLNKQRLRILLSGRWARLFQNSFLVCKDQSIAFNNFVQKLYEANFLCLDEMRKQTCSAKTLPLLPTSNMPSLAKTQRTEKNNKNRTESTVKFAKLRSDLHS